MLLLGLLVLFATNSLIQSYAPIDGYDTTSLKDDEDRLPKYIQPSAYQIKLTPDLTDNNENFKGEVTINFKVIEAEKKIIKLHADKDLKITTADIKLKEIGAGEETEVEIETSDHDEGKHLLIITTKDFLKIETTYILNIPEYTGKLRKDNSGFYLAKYKEGDEIKKLATTQFQSRGARRAFPCFDEPEFKATFTISIAHLDNLNSISNEKTDGEPEKEGETHLVDKYVTTEKMSTYLAAFVVSEFKNSINEIGRVPQRVFARPKAIEEKFEEYALKSGVEIFKKLEEYVKFDYPFSKLDQIAIPDKYFAAGAMENWGLVTYRESRLLYSEKNTTTLEKQRITTVIAHEYSHMWFGNLVTCNWWTNIWLNEGFATYFELFAASLYEEDWRLMDQYILQNVQKAFDKDALSTTKEMNAAGGPPSYVAYQKSGSVIRMLEHIITSENFQKALQSYLQVNKYKSVDSAPLYDAMQKAITEEQQKELLGDNTIAAIMNSWETQPGYPVVTVKRDYSTGEVTLTQERFLLKNDIKEGKSVWYIPINFAFPGNNNNDKTTAEFWLKEEEGKSKPEVTKEKWLIVNKQQTGYYRVNYDEDNWKLLSQQLNSDKYEDINVLNRAQLIDDSLNLARSGRLDYTIALNLVAYLRRESDYIPITSFLNSLSFLHTMLVEKDYNSLKVYVVSLLSNSHKKLKFDEKEDDSHTDKLNRVNVLNWMCKLGDESCIGNATQKLEAWKNDSSKEIPPNLQEPVYCGAMMNAKEDLWNFLYKKFEETDEFQPLVRARLIKTLACSQNEEILQKYLEKILEENELWDKTDKQTLISSVYNSGPTGLKATLKFLKAKYKEINEIFSADVLKTIFTDIGALITTDAKLKELQAIEAEESILKPATEAAEENIKWLTKNGDAISTFLSDFSKGGSAHLSVNIVCLVLGILVVLIRN